VDRRKAPGRKHNRRVKNYSTCRRRRRISASSAVVAAPVREHLDVELIG
jgi:hypothetical protein